jgi:hypothetical protein
MDIIEIGNDIWQVIRLSTGQVLLEGDVSSCEDYVYSMHLRMTGI